MKGNTLRKKNMSFEVQLTEEKFDAIRSGRKLTDTHILVASKLLNAQFPDIPGHQYSGRSQDLSFERLDGSFVQMLNNERDHWLTVEGVHGSLVRVYDCLYCSTTTNTKLSIAAMMRPSSRSISIEIQRMHRQTNAVDCGLYAIAYATELCYGNNPASYVWVHKCYPCFMHR